MRFALRNTKKIEAALGSDFLKWLLKSLEQHFENSTEITPDSRYQNEPYPVIVVSNVQPHTDSDFELYIVSTKYDVCTLAYKGCMG